MFVACGRKSFEETAGLKVCAALAARQWFPIRAGLPGAG